ncbi:MAG TPA: NAD(P)H-dependent oxidoreductase [Sporichthyaceae bacterium]|jgi:multimeric flavodoxin WrbA|nr:NAD(P)H-dependent oxidoreductase [Sporichthyaceae bacterium]
MAKLLIVHHTPSPATAELLDAVRRGATDPDIAGVEVIRRAALAASASDVLGADGFLLGTPANIGYMSGALKHFFDQIYYPVLDDTRGRPYGLWVHGNLDAGGAIRAVESIADALGWVKAAQPVVVAGAPTKDDLAACLELGGTLAAGLMA